MQIVQHTPLWVWGVLTILIVTGLQALRPRVLPVWRLFVVPAIFIAWGVSSIAVRATAVPALGYDWAAALAVGTAIGWITVRLHRFAFEDGARIVRVPGTPMPLIRNASIFFARYGLAVAAAFAAGSAAQGQLLVADVSVSGLATGYFLGWLLRFVRARQASLAAPSAGTALGT